MGCVTTEGLGGVAAFLYVDGLGIGRAELEGWADDADDADGAADTGDAEIDEAGGEGDGELSGTADAAAETTVGGIALGAGAAVEHALIDTTDASTDTTGKMSQRMNPPTQATTIGQ